MTMTDDQYFLLLFVMGTYFGPDIKEEKPEKSAMQRIAQGLPSYTSDQLTGSQMKLSEMERVYFHVLRNSDLSVKVKPTLLHEFFQGSLSIQEQNNSRDCPQFPYLFPPVLHPQSLINNRKVIDNVLFINNPDISYIKPEDIDRFKRLTRLDNVMLDRQSALHPSVSFVGLEDDKNTLHDMKTNNNPCSSRKRKRENENVVPGENLPSIYDAIPMGLAPTVSPSMPYSDPVSFLIEHDTLREERIGPAMLLLPSHPTSGEWNNIVAAAKSGIALTGTAAGRPTGPPVGLVDIGVCDDAYFFRISIPGVKISNEEFICRVESDGKVSISGITSTGEKKVHKCLQVFEMQTQNLCPPDCSPSRSNCLAQWSPKNSLVILEWMGLLRGLC